MRTMTKKDILEALGMQTEDRFLTGLLIGVGLGALVGGLTSLLLAPARGSELRTKLGERMKNVTRRRGMNEMETDFPTGTTMEPGTT